VDLLIVVKYFAGKPKQKQFISRAFHARRQGSKELMLFSVAEGHQGRFTYTFGEEPRSGKAIIGRNFAPKGAQSPTTLQL
jgi:hypothetical protein